MSTPDTAAYATSDEEYDDPDGRAHHEPHPTMLRPFELDRHRILASTAFRRLEGKTQVFAPGHHDHFRTRLTHTLEVAHIARCLARLLRCNEGLTEAIVLAHDLGHAPFGHAGEAALNNRMKDHGGFNHNAHSLRVVDYLEHPIPDFRGLNLTRATRDGLRSHVTRYDTPGHSSAESKKVAQVVAPLPGKEGGKPADHSGSDARMGANASANTDAPCAGDSARAGDGADQRAFVRVSGEAQIASMADRIAYDCHDLEDAIGAGVVHADDLAEVALWRNACDSTGVAPIQGNIHTVRRVVLDGMQHALLADAAQTSRPLLSAAGRASGDCTNSFPVGTQERRVADPLIQLSATVARQLDALEDFLGTQVYRHPDIARTDAAGRDMIGALFDRLVKHVDLLPERFRGRIDEQGVECVVCDYIAGMTDRFCRDAHDRLIVSELGARPETG